MMGWQSTYYPCMLRRIVPLYFLAQLCLQVGRPSKPTLTGPCLSAKTDDARNAIQVIRWKENVEAFVKHWPLFWRLSTTVAAAATTICSRWNAPGSGLWGHWPSLLGLDYSSVTKESHLAIIAHCEQRLGEVKLAFIKRSFKDEFLINDRKMTALYI